MPLDDLVTVIETLQGRIEKHGASLRENETRTRMALIDPLLQTLGWDTADPGLVTPEYNVSGKRADYALLDGKRSPMVFLEAKRLDELLSNHRSQVAAYASELGIKYPALTNGNDWEVYDNSKLVPIEQRSILNLSIKDSDAHQTALQLLLLWRPNLASGQPIAASEPVFAEFRNTKTTAEADVDTSTTPAIEKPVPSVSEGWTSLVDYRPRPRSQSPSAIRFPNGEERTSQYQKHILIEASEYLIRIGKLTADNCPVGNGPRRNIVHSRRQHKDGQTFVDVHLLSNGLFLETKNPAPQTAKNALFLMKHFGEDPAAVLLKLN